MLTCYNKDIIKEGNKLRMKLMFDIIGKINYHSFFKARYFKGKEKENLVLKFTKC